MSKRLLVLLIAWILFEITLGIAIAATERPRLGSSHTYLALAMAFFAAGWIYYGLRSPHPQRCKRQTKSAGNGNTHPGDPE